MWAQSRRGPEAQPAAEHQGLGSRRGSGSRSAPAGCCHCLLTSLPASGFPPPPPPSAPLQPLSIWSTKQPKRSSYKSDQVSAPFPEQNPHWSPTHSVKAHILITTLKGPVTLPYLSFPCSFHSSHVACPPCPECTSALLPHVCALSVPSA